jgi:DNA-binding response OmpR family regulator
MRVLLLEDDYLYKVSIKEFLEEFNYQVDAFEDGQDALDAIYDKSYTALLLDIRVPTVDGFKILQKIRKDGIKTPVIILTSLTDIEDLSLGYELGCSDYIKKPFELRELKYRLEQIIKRNLFNSQDKFVQLEDSYKFNVLTKQLFKNETEIELSAIEQQLVNFLVKNRGMYQSLDTLQYEVWEGKDISYSDIRMCIKRVRAKTQKEFIKTKKFVGYKIG